MPATFHDRLRSHHQAIWPIPSPVIPTSAFATDTIAIYLDSVFNERSQLWDFRIKALWGSLSALIAEGVVGVMSPVVDQARGVNSTVRMVTEARKAELGVADPVAEGGGGGGPRG